ncbi:MAG: LON peptidase substrate-binding domain-containing protein, partial [Planctomycetota bacterium]
MADNIERLIPSNGCWLVEVAADDPADIEELLNNENSLLYENSHDFKMPRQLGILPVRNVVVFPGTVMPLAIGRKKSKSLIANTRSRKSIIGLVTQKNSETDRPNFSDLYTIGTAASILKVIKMPQGSIHIVVHSIERFKIVKRLALRPFLRAVVAPLHAKVSMTKRLKALIVSVRQTAQRVIELNPHVPEEAAILLENIENPSALADFLAANLNLPIEEKQGLLEEIDAAKRLEKISMALASQLDVLELSHKIQGQVKQSIDKNQREYFLQEQLKAIQTELGTEDRHSEELKEIRRNIKKAKMPKKTEAEALRELDRLSKVPPASPEYSVIRTYLDWVCELPWSKRTVDQLDIKKAQRTLNRDHYNLLKVKKRILEFLAVRKLNPQGKSPILCFVGPPGVGKT